MRRRPELIILGSAGKQKFLAEWLIGKQSRGVIELNECDMWRRLFQLGTFEVVLPSTPTKNFLS
jgi:hypothetical protein